MIDLYKPRPDRLIRLRFALKTVFSLVTLFGAWLGVHAKWIRDRHLAIRHLVLEGSVCAARGDGVKFRETPLALRLLGEPPIQWIGLEATQRSERARLRELFPEAVIVDAKLLPDGRKAYAVSSAAEDPNN